jgi:DNA-binding CsgD family transcriptional regulator
VAATGVDPVRSAEWRRVRDFSRAVRASPAALVIQGEAGAGKSTLWRAGFGMAAAAGYRLLRSEPSASESSLSFAGLSDLLADVFPLVASQIPGPQREALEIALLLRSAGQEPPTAHAVGLGVLAALRGCLADGPVLVAVDDVHWLDEASRAALAFALRRVTAGPLSLLMAARIETAADPLTAGGSPPSRDWHGLLAALPAAEVINLAPLDMWQVRSLLPGTVTAAQAQVVARQSRGNPFWAIQVAASLGSDGSEVPPLARVLTDRLSRSLSADAAAVLAVVAASGRIGVPGALATLDHLADPAVAVDEAVVAGVVVETGGRLAAAHPLIGAAAVESLPPGRRTRLYRRLALASSSPERYAHFAVLAAGPDPDSAVAEALDAAAAAAHARAGNAAAANFASQAVRFTAESDHVAVVRRRIRAAELFYLAGDVEQSLEHLEALDTGRLATADLEQALPLLLDGTGFIHGTMPANALVTRVLAEAGSEPRRRALLFSVASDATYGLRGGRRSAAIEAIRCAEIVGAAADAALHRSLVNLFLAKVAAAEEFDVGLLDRAARLEASLPPLMLHDTADMFRSWCRYTEDLAGARTALHRCIARATDIGDDVMLASFSAFLATTEVLAGDYAAAAVAVDAAFASAAWHNWPPRPWHIEPRCELLIRDGDLDGASVLVEERLPDTPGTTHSSRFMGAVLRGKLNAWRGDHTATVRYLERAVQYAEQLDWVDPGVRSRLDITLAEAYVVTGRVGDARQMASRLRHLGERLSRHALTGDAERIDALVFAADGDLDAAAGSARAAVAAHGASPLRLELARSLLVLGQIERRRKARRQSREALRRAHELATEMGHRPLLAEIERELPRVAAARSGTGLTATERRVADLIAGGATNRDAAAMLFVSVRTIESHAASIYRKLGVRTRAQLARRVSGSA